MNVIRMPRTKMIVFNGFKLKTYSVGWLALLTDRTTFSVRRWEADGYLPRPLIKAKGDNARWYSAAELRGYAEVYRNANVRTNVRIDDTPFKRHAFIFRANLQAHLRTNPRILGNVLQGEEGLRDVRKKVLLAKLHKELEKLIPERQT